ncbi:hypothetical protein [Treponema porcinum]|uniref:hypothetical protein n=1 Tax=Treponema porcinum TaxID=261392 RepID=UPI003F00A45C
MGTTIAGNQHIGSNYAQYQYLWKPGSGGDYGTVELYEEDRIFVYQFNPIYDQRDDGVLAVEFYYYYRKPTSEKFYEYCYHAEDFYIYPFLAWYDEDGEDGGAWGGITTIDSQKISLVGRESGWIHVTLHVDEYIWGRFTNNGKTFDNTIYIGVYSPILVLNWDTSSANASGGVVPYEIFWNFDEYEDDTVYDLMTGGNLEDCYEGRRQINDYPSFYITYRDVTPESFNYAVNEQSVVNVSSGVARKTVLKKLMSEIKAITGTAGRHQLHKRNAGVSALGASDSFAKRVYFARLLSETKSMATLLSRKHFMTRQFNDVFEPVAFRNYKRFLFRSGDENLIAADTYERKLAWKRQLDLNPSILTEVVRSGESFRGAIDVLEVSALPFASRLFFRTVQTVVGFWDWLRGKIREANNVVTLYSPMDLEITLESKI